RVRQGIWRVQVRVRRDSDSEPFNQLAAKPASQKCRADSDKRERERGPQLLYRVNPVQILIILLTKFPEKLFMNGGDGFGIDFRLAVVRKQSVDLLLDIGQLRVTKPCKKVQGRDAFHQVTILFEQFFIRLKRIIKPVKQIAFLRWNVRRYC